MEKDTRYFKCITDKYGNFKCEKVYEAKPQFYKLDKSPTEFRITDEDGDYYTVDLTRDIGRRKMFIEVYSI